MKKTLGKFICEKRKAKGMTQLELAEKMGVSDKAVSKWERDLSCPDISSLPKLAQLFDLTIDELMQTDTTKKETNQEMVQLVCKAIALAMGISVFVLLVLNTIEIKNALLLLAIGMICVSISLLEAKKIN